LSDSSGNNLGNLTTAPAGKQLIISVKISNNQAGHSQPFALPIEVRDASGMTVFIGFESGVARSSDSSSVKAGWMPSEKGVYEVRAFAISGIDQGYILSPIVSTHITIQ
jgi:hypothetical protein